MSSLKGKVNEPKRINKYSSNERVVRVRRAAKRVRTFQYKLNFEDISATEKRISKLLQKEKDLNKDEVKNEIKLLDDRIEAQTKAKKGLEHMMKTYETQGDTKSAASVKTQIGDCGSEIDRLTALRARLTATAGGKATEQKKEAPKESHKEKKARALYNFDGTDASQLSIKTGNIIAILDDQNEDWWEGELNGKTGYFPRTYVELIDQEVEKSLTVRKKVKALYDFEGKGKGELPIRTGDVITLVSIMPSSSEWLEGELNGKVGFFPRLYVEYISDGTKEDEEPKKTETKANSQDAKQKPGEEPPKSKVEPSPKKEEVKKDPPKEPEKKEPPKEPEKKDMKDHLLKGNTPERKMSVSRPPPPDNPRKNIPSMRLSKIPFQGKARAVFDYEGTGDTELSIEPGDIINIISTEDDEWWEGECDGRFGFFPKLYVELIKNPSEPTRVKAVHDYVAESDTELSLKNGDIINVLDVQDEEWWEGKLNGKIGFFPKEFVVVIEDGRGRRNSAAKKEEDKRKELEMKSVQLKELQAEEEKKQNAAKEKEAKEREAKERERLQKEKEEKEKEEQKKLEEKKKEEERIKQEKEEKAKKEEEERIKKEQEEKAKKEEEEREMERRKAEEKKREEERRQKEEEEKRQREEEKRKREEEERRQREEEERKREAEERAKKEEEERKKREEKLKKEEEKRRDEERRKKEEEEKKRREEEERKREEEEKRKKEERAKHDSEEVHRREKEGKEKPLPPSARLSRNLAESTAVSISLEELKGTVTRLEESVTTNSPDLSNELDAIAKSIEQNIRQNFQQLQAKIKNVNDISPVIEDLKNKLRIAEAKCEEIDVERQRASRFEAEVKALKKKLNSGSAEVPRSATLASSLATLESHLKILQKITPNSKHGLDGEGKAKLSRGLHLLKSERNAFDKGLQELLQSRSEIAKSRLLEEKFKLVDSEFVALERKISILGVGAFGKDEDFWKSLN